MYIAAMLSDFALVSCQDMVSFSGTQVIDHKLLTSHTDIWPIDMSVCYYTLFCECLCICNDTNMVVCNIIQVLTLNLTVTT